MRWYDIDLFTMLYKQHVGLTGSERLVDYGLTLATNYSIEHAASLAVLLENPPVSWQV